MPLTIFAKHSILDVWQDFEYYQMTPDVKSLSTLPFDVAGNHP